MNFLLIFKFNKKNIETIGYLFKNKGYKSLKIIRLLPYNFFSVVLDLKWKNHLKKN